MIYHNAKNGFPSTILNEQYKLDAIRRYCTKDNKLMMQRIPCDVCVTHDMLGSSLSIRLNGKVYVITMDKIIKDILEVEHENENLYSDR